MQLSLVANVVLGLWLSVAAYPTNFTRAPIIVDNPSKLFEARLLEKNSTTIRGALNIWARSVGVKVHADFWGLPKEEALSYHIHAHRVPENGSCEATGPHLDPYGRGQYPPCDATHPETCEVGDLSGKHGPIYTAVFESFEAEYPDHFLSTNPDSPAYFGDLSIVVHGTNGERLNCGNFVLKQTGTEY
jgi:hypothetical protein